MLSTNKSVLNKLKILFTGKIIRFFCARSSYGHLFFFFLYPKESTIYCSLSSIKSIFDHDEWKRFFTYKPLIWKKVKKKRKTTKTHKPCFCHVYDMWVLNENSGDKKAYTVHANYCSQKINTKYGENWMKYFAVGKWVDASYCIL